MPVKTGRRLQLDGFGQIGQSFADAPQWRQDLRVAEKTGADVSIYNVGSKTGVPHRVGGLVSAYVSPLPSARRPPASSAPAR